MTLRAITPHATDTELEKPTYEALNFIARHCPAQFAEVLTPLALDFGTWINIDEIADDLGCTPRSISQRLATCIRQIFTGTTPFQVSRTATQAKIEYREPSSAPSKTVDTIRDISQDINFQLWLSKFHSPLREVVETLATATGQSFSLDEICSKNPGLKESDIQDLLSQFTKHGESAITSSDHFTITTDRVSKTFRLETRKAGSLGAKIGYGPHTNNDEVPLAERPTKPSYTPDKTKLPLSITAWLATNFEPESDEFAVIQILLTRAGTDVYFGRISIEFNKNRERKYNRTQLLHLLERVSQNIDSKTNAPFEILKFNNENYKLELV